MQKDTKNETKLVSNVERGKRVREERKRLRLTQQDAADTCGVHRVQWGRYERGEQGFDGEPLRKFGELGASISYILTGEKANAVAIGEIKADKTPIDHQTQDLIKFFNSMTPEKQEILLQTAKVFAKESGHIDLLLSCMIIFFAFMAWLFGAIANYISSFDTIAESMSYGITAVIFWGTAMAILGIKYSIIRKQ